MPEGPLYAIQDKAWMDSEEIKTWVDVMLAPFVKTAPCHINPVLFLDSYHAHMMEEVVSRIQDLGVEVWHIPGGCRFVSQLILAITDLSKLISRKCGNNG